jgi:PTS system nitrogen regulatory IIA component
MDIQAIVSLDRTECAVQCNSKKRILEIIADIAAKQNENIDQATVLNSLMARERMGSTGIGNGIALPHGRLPGLEKVIAIVVTSTPAIDFDALDEKPVDIFLHCLFPRNKPKDTFKRWLPWRVNLATKKRLRQYVAQRRATIF